MATSSIFDAIQKHRMHHPWQCGNHVAKGLVANATRISDSLFLLSKGLANTVEDDAARTLQRAVRAHLFEERHACIDKHTTSGFSGAATAATTTTRTTTTGARRAVKKTAVDIIVQVLTTTTTMTEASEESDVAAASRRGGRRRGEKQVPETEDTDDSSNSSNDEEEPEEEAGDGNDTKTRRQRRRERIKRRRRLVRTRIKRLLCASTPLDDEVVLPSAYDHTFLHAAATLLSVV